MDIKLPPEMAKSYRIIGEIGSGGGGVIYLAEHLRLNKKVVLKADKRKMSVKLETLRREVDALKNLHHPNIPQVYDFIIENDRVYTVLDFIDGESLEKPLKRGEKFEQATIINWACSLLRALVYLHSRPPHGILHADIKPGNVMLTSAGEIRLIDFNIALSLGEEGAVAVGRSFGYASPEHYRYVTRFNNNFNTEDNGTVAMVQPGDETLTLPVVKTVTGFVSSNSSSNQVILDVRSDIYSLGATLYHLITGIKPAQKAEQVIAISPNQASQPLIDIISKAMSPDPDKRYQSAAEMLDALLNIKKQDIRYKRYKRRFWLASTFLLLTFCASAFIFVIGLKQLENQEKNYKLAEYSSNELAEINVDAAISYALQALPENKNIFTPPDSAEAQLALTTALNVYDLSDSYSKYKSFDLPAKPIDMILSPNQKMAMALCDGQFVLFELESAEILATVPAVRSALAEMEFIDDDRILLAAADGLGLYSIAQKKMLWQGELATAISYAPQKQLVAAIYKDNSKTTVYNVADGSVYQEIDFVGKKQSVVANDIFANPKDNLFELSPNGDYLAISFDDGSCYLSNLENVEDNIILLDETSGFHHFEGGFKQQYFALVASKQGMSTFTVIDIDKQVEVGGFQSEVNFGLKLIDDKIVLQNANILVEFNPETGEQVPLVTTEKIIEEYALNSNYTVMTDNEFYSIYDKNAALVLKAEKIYNNEIIALSDEFIVFATLDSPAVQLLKFENHSQDTIFTFDSKLDFDEARISANGKTVMFFSYDKFELYALSGELIKSQAIPNAKEVYDQQYRKEENSYLDVIYNDGSILSYSAVDGKLLAQKEQVEVTKDLSESFETNKYIINSSLHKGANVIDKKTGKEVKQLSKDDYLTYVTEVDDQIIAEYISVTGLRYGLLLNQNLESIAYLPHLCDVYNNELIFKYDTGNLRKSNIYTLQALRQLGQARLEK